MLREVIWKLCIKYNDFMDWRGKHCEVLKKAVVVNLLELLTLAYFARAIYGASGTGVWLVLNNSGR